MADPKSLLTWSIENSTEAISPNKVESVQEMIKKDPGILEAIFGKDDATKMREAVNVITDLNLGIEDRLIAWDNLELLVEDLDNADNMHKMNLWPSIISALERSDSREVVYALWIIGTAAQNHYSVQKILLEDFHLFDKIYKKLQNGQNDLNVKRKIIYVFNSLGKTLSQEQIDFIFEQSISDVNLLRKALNLFRSQGGLAPSKIGSALDNFPNDEDIQEIVAHLTNTKQ